MTTKQPDLISLPTDVREALEAQMSFWTSRGMGKEPELRGLAQFIPEALPRNPGRFPFLIVPRWPATIRLDQLMRLVVAKGNRGRDESLFVGNSNHYDYDLDPGLVAGGYVLLDVEDGRCRLGVEQKQAIRDIQGARRLTYNVLEGIAHAAVLPVLQHHNLDLLDPWGSMYETLHICLRDGLPVLDTRGHEGQPQWGAPSCAARKGAVCQN